MRLSFALGLAVVIVCSSLFASGVVATYLFHLAFFSVVALAAVTLLYERRNSIKISMDSEAIAHALLDASIDAAILIDRSETILAVNDTVAMSYGYSKRDMCGKKLEEILCTNELAEWRNYLSSVLLLGQTQIFGTARNNRHFENRVYPIVDSHGRVVRLGLYKRDVTEQIHSEQSLRENRDFLQSIINHVPVTMFVKDAETRQYLIWNKFGEELYGITAEEALGKTDDAFVPKERAEALRKKDDELLAHRVIVDIPEEVVQSRVHGLMYIHTLKVPVYDEQGRPRYILGFSENITERRRAYDELRLSEERLRKAQDAAHIGSWELDFATQMLWGSECAFDIYGLEMTQDQTLPLDEVQRIVQTHDRERMDLALSDLINYGTTYDVEFRINRFNDGESRMVQSRGELLRDDQGRPLKIVGTLQDITERKLLEHQLIQAQKLEGIGTLAGGIAHDFNNLLAMVLGTAELLKKRLAKMPDLHRHIDRIIETTQRGTSITKQLLLFSRQDFADLEAISLSHIIAEVQEMMAHFLPKDITVKIDIGVQNGIIMGDSGYIHQALMNLAINARDAMPHGGTLTFSASSVDSTKLRTRFSDVEDGAYIALSVSDTGRGMNDDVRRKIYDPFFTTKDKGKGTGLGLAIVHSIVKSHRGFIDVETELDQGSTFTMYFPALAQRKLPSRTTVDRCERGNETILLVDDEKIIREMLEEHLLAEGYAVMIASNGAEALEKYTHHSRDIDLVITDLGMPHMDGEVLFAKLREMNPVVKVIISSGYLDKTSKTDMIARGVKDVLTKPYKFDEIQRSIRSVLDAGD
ncbi:MAG TPA: PAS domain S-box protein [Bacteroidota bacterium]|nr:PAS domain S-box protein [Bacteroidota bacterium]